MEEIKCECSDEVLEIKDLHIEDNSFSDGFGTVSDVDITCPNCGASMGEFASLDDVIEARSEW
jgi:hypothetical protein